VRISRGLLTVESEHWPSTSMNVLRAIFGIKTIDFATATCQSDTNVTGGSAFKSVGKISVMNHAS